MKTLACTACRQDKVKCDASNAPTPKTCSRCIKLKKSCVFNPDFKRISKKTQVQQLRNELKLYKHALNSGDIVDLTSAPTEHLTESDTLNNNNDIDSEEAIQPCSSEKTLGMIVLSADKITQLFKIFFDRCHQYLSFRISRSADTVYDDCPLLFWVICNTASILDQSLHSQLYPQVQRLISEVTLFPARQIEIVQALIISSLWPFPSTSLLGDSSYLLSGLAIHIGLQIGLHRPECSYEFSSKLEVLKIDTDTRRATWLSCFSTNYWYSAKLGVPNTFVQDSHFISMIDNPSTSESLSRKCKLCRLALSACNALGAEISRPNIVNLLNYENRLRMIKMYITELTALQMTNSNKDSPILKVMFLGSRLQIFSFALVEMPIEMGDNIENGSRHIVIEIFYQAALDAIKLIDIFDEEVDKVYAPTFILRLVIYSTLILLWIRRSKYANNAQQITLTVTKAQELLTKLSRYERDEPQRAITLISSFSISEQDKRKSQPVRSRMSATLLYESIRMSKENSNDIVQKLLDSLLKDDDLSLTQEFNL